MKCKECNGRGWYLADLNPDISNEYGEIECPICNGKGDVE
jgi:DnaJ-class molecular chaperone